VDARKDTLRVPSKALRYQPSNAATLTAAETNGSVTAHPSSQEPSRTAGFGSGSGRVWILRDGEPQPVIVHTGLDDGSWTEITGGSLAVGDKVILGESSAANGRISTGRSSSPTGIRLR